MRGAKFVCSSCGGYDYYDSLGAVLIFKGMKCNCGGSLRFVAPNTGSVYKVSDVRIDLPNGEFCIVTDWGDMYEFGGRRE
jgi:hypothetical protein